MSILKSIKRFFTGSQNTEKVKEPKPPKHVRGRVIECQECHKFGHEVYLPGFVTELSRGWHCVYVGLKRYYICPDCLQAKRQRWENYNKSNNHLTRVK